jgi:hypothetical protein
MAKIGHPRLAVGSRRRPLPLRRSFVATAPHPHAPLNVRCVRLGLLVDIGMQAHERPPPLRHVVGAPPGMRMPRDGADPFFFLDPTRAHEGRCIGGGGRGLLGASMAVIDSLILGIRARADGENRRSVRKIVNLKFGSSEPGRSETSKDLSQTIQDSRRIVTSTKSLCLSPESLLKS